MSFARVIVDNRVRVLLRDIGPEVADRLCALFEHKNAQHEKLKHMGFRFDHRKEPKVIRTWRIEGDWLSLPRGGMRRVREHLIESGVDLRVRDDRTEGLDKILNGFVWPAYKRTLYPDQEEALAAILARETCYLRAPTAAGKTTIATAAIHAIRRPACVAVWTGSLFDQWVERVVDEMGFRERDVGKVRGGTRRVGPVTIAMQQTLAKLSPADPFFRCFGVFIADELQRFSAPTFVASIDPFTSRYRIGISADERRKDRKEFMAHDAFADMAISIDRKELVEKGRVRDVEIRVVPTGWHPTANEWELEDAEPDFGTLIDQMARSESRDALILEIVEDELARGEQILIFSLRVEHCRMLVARLTNAGITTGLMLGGAENRVALRATVESMRAKTMRVAVGTTQAVGTGVDLPSVGVGIAAMPVASNKQDFNQLLGRVCRIAGGDDPARFYVLADPCRRKDWSSYFLDSRPVYVRRPDWEWVDARTHRRLAKEVAFPKEESWP